MNLSTNYLGLALKNPIVASSSPLSHNVDSIRRLEDAGAAAVVMYSLFEEQITFDGFYIDHYLTSGINSFAESLSYLPEMQSYNVSPDAYMNLIRRAKEAVDIPIIGSLSGISASGWTDYAVLMEQAGADAIELNVYYIPTNSDLNGTDVENIYLTVLREVKRSVPLPVAIKLSPYFSATANMAKLLVAEGANGLVLFNRFYQPDIDLETLEVVPVQLDRYVAIWNLRSMSSDAIRGIIEAKLPSQYEPQLLTFYGNDVRTDGKIIIFGDDGGTNLCLNKEDGFIYSVDPKDELPTRFVNTSAICLATFLALHLQFTTTVVHADAEDDPGQLVRLLREQFINIDSTALDDSENWWAVVLE